MCYVFVALTLKQLLSHINTMHSRSPDFCVVCGIDGCSNESRVHNSFYCHVKRTSSRNHGDALAQHEVAGFKEGVGFAYSRCRHCECNFEDMQKQFNEDLFVKRTMASHNRQCSDIEKASTDFLREHLKSTFGINWRSKLTEFPHFDIINQTPQDVMCVILEGAAPYEIKCVLKHLVLSGHMDLKKKKGSHTTAT